MLKDKSEFKASNLGKIYNKTQSKKKKRNYDNKKFQRPNNLSLNFYNHQTLTGSKKIMLDLLPIETVHTQQFLTHTSIQLKKKQKPNNFKQQNQRKHCKHISLGSVQRCNKHIKSGLIYCSPKKSANLSSTLKKRNTYQIKNKMQKTQQMSQKNLVAHKKSLSMGKHEKYLKQCLKKVKFLK